VARPQHCCWMVRTARPCAEAAVRCEKPPCAVLVVLCFCVRAASAARRRDAARSSSRPAGAAGALAAAGGCLMRCTPRTMPHRRPHERQRGILLRPDMTTGGEQQRRVRALAAHLCGSSWPMVAARSRAPHRCYPAAAAAAGGGQTAVLLGPLVGFVSDERYLAVPDCQLELTAPDGVTRYSAVSSATGGVYADLAPGTYEVALNARGFGAKRSRLIVDSDQANHRPHHFRLLRDQLLGYVWPKYTRAGGAGEFRVHSHVAYKLSLWRYGEQKVHERKIGWFDEHGPRATVQVTPDGDYTQSGVCWNQVGFPNPQHKQFIQAPSRTGLYYFHAEAENGAFFSFPWLVAPAAGSGPRPPVALMLADINWNAYNNFGGRSNYIHPDR
jgi:hypothetical protein